MAEPDVFVIDGLAWVADRPGKHFVGLSLDAGEETYPLASIGDVFDFSIAGQGDLYLPIPFARSCKVTMSAKPFYNIINYRAYADGTTVETFSKEQLEVLWPM